MTESGLSGFLNMGGYGLYVWGSYGLTFALIALELVLVFQRRKDTTRSLLRWRRAVGKGAGKRNGDGMMPAMESET